MAQSLLSFSSRLCLGQAEDSDMSSAHKRHAFSSPRRGPLQADETSLPFAADIHLFSLGARKISKSSPATGKAYKHAWPHQQREVSSDSTQVLAWTHLSSSVLGTLNSGALPTMQFMCKRKWVKAFLMKRFSMETTIILCPLGSGLRRCGCNFHFNPEVSPFHCRRKSNFLP